MPTDWFGYNFNVLRAAGDLDEAEFLGALAGLQAATLRIPGGTVGEYWDWSRGGLALPPYSGLPEGPPFNDEQRAITGASPERVRTALQAASASPHFALNILSADLATNLADLDRFAALGLPVSRIEIGNEEYFRSPNTRARFPDAAAYAALVSEWAVTLRARFPGARLAAIAPSPVRLTGIAFGDWLEALNEGNVWTVVDAVAIHPYAEAAFSTQQRTDAQASAAVSALLAADAAYLRAVVAAIPAATRIWITEWNIVDEASPLVMAGSWVHGLSSLVRAMEFLAVSQVDLSLQHVVLGDRQWQALTGRDGRAIDYANGVAGEVTVAPYTATPGAIALALLGTASRPARSAQRLGLGVDEASSPLRGWRFFLEGGAPVSLVVNPTGAPIRLDMTGRARVLSAPAWSSPLGGEGLNDTLVSPGADGLTLPSFGAALVDESAQAGLF